MSASSWASRVRDVAADVAPQQDALEGGDYEEQVFRRCMKTTYGKVAVVDANALIHGSDVRLREAMLGAADSAAAAAAAAAAFDGAQREKGDGTGEVAAVTVPEVLAELRDEALRRRLAALQVRLLVRTPRAESLAAVRRLAMQTGDAASLSEPDVALLALAHTLEIEKHGSTRIRENVVARTAPSSSKGSARGGGRAGVKLPNWGEVDNPEDWAAVDEADSDDDGSGEHDNGDTVGNSHVASAATPLVPTALQKGDDETTACDAAATTAADDDDGDEWETAASRKAVMKSRKREGRSRKQIKS